MKQLLIGLFLLIGMMLIGCEKSLDNTNSSGGAACGSVNGHPLQRGPEGGCYYVNDSGNKEYVDRSECNCN